MKRKQLLKEIAKLGAKFVRHGGKHDIYGTDTKSMAVPRHSEVDEEVAKDIIRFFTKI